ncbi:low molecular weight phosphatase family protein [Mycolicibacterium sp. OfavD-34-C]|uniref:arsenate reductase/protein-tyrosine-phosphatase family protein n=1 Tax=Mycolicibacterium sp. OfavD-34-C TaxID=2917746 RepID=UPI001EF51704|nr:low molecular weight phosphatase family protein [Mycolicibacterium sp. OfavD-34-C]MCG7580082.1 low molecular weight phosphatase family protein [Mycolicibacterium sp. OfavD-34-C]
MRILFVCTGNICRSPTAERLSARFIRDRAFTDVTAASAGTRAVVGQPIQHNAASVLRQLGGDPANFQARQLSPKTLADADLVLTMTRGHRDAVLAVSPRFLHRTFTLAEATRLVTDVGVESIEDLSAARSHVASGPSLDIRDPVNEPLDFFKVVGDEINSLLPPILELCFQTARSS